MVVRASKQNPKSDARDRSTIKTALHFLSPEFTSLNKLNSDQIAAWACSLSVCHSSAKVEGKRLSVPAHQLEEGDAGLCSASPRQVIRSTQRKRDPFWEGTTLTASASREGEKQKLIRRGHWCLVTVHTGSQRHGGRPPLRPQEGRT